MAGDERRDVWARGNVYEPYVGRWSRLVARDFLAWLALADGLEWLDVGCGTGALSEAILEQATPIRVLGVDSSDGYLDHARSRIKDPRAAFALGDARSLPCGGAEFDAAVSGLVLNFVPDPGRALAEMRRAVRPGGAVAAYVWDYAERMELMRYFWDAAVALDPAALALDEGRRFPLCRPEPLVDLFRGAGLRSVATCEIDVPTRFRDFVHYWTPFLGGQGPAPGYCVSLTEERRGALRERIRSALPVSPDGSIRLVARAWAVRGRVP